MLRFIALFVLTAFVSIPARAESVIDTAAKQAIVVDYETGTVLFEKNADEKMPTSSMSKVMTMYMVFDALKKGQLGLENQLMVSERAWKMEGSKMFIEVGKQIKVEDLIRGVIVQSGNDATVVLAEGMSGSEDVFAHNMTEKAHSIGMTNSNFTNSNGMPDPNHYSTARDLATMAKTLIREFPEYYKYYSEKEFTYNTIKQGNRNPLLYLNIGADGVKTGHTEAAGFGLIGSGVSPTGRRVIFVLNGMKDEKERAQEGAKILEWGLKNFENKKLFKEGDTVAQAKVAMGQARSVPLIVKNSLLATVPATAVNNFKVTANFKEPLVAPVAEGQEVGTITVDVPTGEQMKFPLYAGQAVPKLGAFAGMLEKARMMLTGS
ncbi:MAG: D-alanyl-D-alanine carboxypeptidase family protein [Alphaproteobacteria bacterium]